MKIYTRTGDGGRTSLWGGSRVPKSHQKIEACGSIDELNSYIGLVGDQATDEERKGFLNEIQDRLFFMGSLFAAASPVVGAGKWTWLSEDIEKLEMEIDRMSQALPELRYFILPGGHPYVSTCHIARCICRRAEREAIRLNELEPIEDVCLSYLNRLSDYLFVLSRKIGQELNIRINVNGGLMEKALPACNDDETGLYEEGRTWVNFETTTCTFSTSLGTEGMTRFI